MLDKLIESKNCGNENARRGGFLLTAFMAVSSILSFALIYSLFSYNLALGSEKLDISTLVAPVKILDETQPPPAEKVAAPKQQNAENPVSKLPVRQENIQRTDESPVKLPEKISAAPNAKQSRPLTSFTIGASDSNPIVSGVRVERSSNGDNRLLSIKLAGDKAKTEEEQAPPMPVKVQTPKPVSTPPIIKSEGVVNGKAINLVKPKYPPAAIAVRASGAVNVQVTIDEDGNVTSANALSGHQLLRAAAEQAARVSKFSPTFLSRQKVKVTGVIVYNFNSQ